MRAGVLSVLLAIALVIFPGCASEEQRYQANKTEAILSPRAKVALSPADIDQIARLVAHASRKRILGISAASKRMYPNSYRNTWDLTVGLPWSEQGWDYGVYTVARDGGGWRFIRRGESLSLSLVGMSMQDPPDE